MTDDARPPTLLVAAALVGLEGLFVCVLAVLEVVALDTDRVALGITTALFFLVLGAGLMFCAWGLFRVRSWARGPVVATALIGVLLSFSFWGGETTLAAVVILLVSLAVLVGVLHPASTRALAADDG
ncbi:MAG: hypothetical protein QOD98_2037 [Nocardioidaceae bacterium]|nr:hypothetical protein [Nocardioidaceae bacterium]